MINLPWFVTPYHTATLAALVALASRPSLASRRVIRREE